MLAVRHHWRIERKMVPQPGSGAQAWEPAYLPGFNVRTLLGLHGSVATRKTAGLPRLRGSHGRTQPLRACSRLMVLGARFTVRAIARTVNPSPIRNWMWTPSSMPKY
jgi:hypothetical protein